MAPIKRIVPIVATITLLGPSVCAAASIAMAYCADINTASTSGNSSTWQSDGLCKEFCADDYAFSVIKDSECWCTDYVPDSSTQADIGECDKECPGFPSDVCGGDGLWGYIAQAKEPAGTTGGSTSTPTTTSKQDTPTETVHNTVTVTPTADPTTTTPETTDKPTETDTDTDTDTEETTTRSPTPTVSIATVTAGGTVSLQTVTVMPTVTANPSSDAHADASSTDMQSSSHGLSTGAAVGTAVGVLGAVILLGAIAALFWFRRKRRQEEQRMVETHGSFRGSSAGMMSTPTTAMASVWDGENMSMGRRNSRLMPHDPRMDPYATNIYNRFDNKSHESINTLQDNQDYSRKVLRTTNPDPEDRE